MYGDSLKLNDILELSIQLDETLLPYKFDLIIFNQIKNTALIEHIDTIGITLYQKQ
ncbi:hypothetical protein KMW28_13735 [Flammeovirga yaeyamensis]|uniref:Uncharacterized protein n=1 Tax=Flammeovirga yaeyamensis TaxID=367791 RepID=A0AAX1N473_9BACT|nr:hypothetical protein [Flammeovirga yaeyamensis]QWG00713.1 hypothetical protein KMW28_13735 [Flammeovirga yaeyamensis]